MNIIVFRVLKDTIRVLIFFYNRSWATGRVKTEEGAVVMEFTWFTFRSISTFVNLFFAFCFMFRFQLSLLSLVAYYFTSVCH